MRLIFCTHNINKCEEISSLFPNSFKIDSLNDIQHHHDIIESGDTLEDNSLIKAQEIFKLYKLPCFADDSGLEVEILNGQPGVYSARFAGLEKNDDNNMTKLLSMLEPFENRKAAFRTVITYIDNKGVKQFIGTTQGEITLTKIGNNGFGYDPIFKPEGSSKTFGEMKMSEKNKFSHRAKALKKFLDFILLN